MSKWKRFKKSCGPMTDEQREAWKPLAVAMMFTGTLKIITGIVILFIVYGS